MFGSKEFLEVFEFRELIFKTTLKTDTLQISNRKDDQSIFTTFFSGTLIHTFTCHTASSSKPELTVQGNSTVLNNNWFEVRLKSGNKWDLLAGETFSSVSMLFIHLTHISLATF